MSGRLVLYGDEKDPWIALDYYQVFEEGRGRIDIWHNYTTYTRYIIPFAEIKAILIQYKADDHTYTTERFRELLWRSTFHVTKGAYMGKNGITRDRTGKPWYHRNLKR